MSVSAKDSIDMRGRKITTFILYNAVLKLKDMAQGDVLEIVTEDYEPIESDIRAWCRMTGNSLVELQKESNRQRYYIEKVKPAEKENKLALVISNPGLEELLSPLGFALGAALGGTGPVGRQDRGVLWSDDPIAIEITLGGAGAGS